MNSDSVLEIFREITRIPRESGHEQKMTAFLQQFAKEHSLACKTDEIGNVLITKEASKGKENVPAIVLQSHQDMVCEKLSGCVHDFSKDPIDYVVEDGWMIAKQTTLGADDGIGVAASSPFLKRLGWTGLKHLSRDSSQPRLLSIWILKMRVNFLLGVQAGSTLLLFSVTKVRL